MNGNEINADELAKLAWKIAAGMKSIMKLLNWMGNKEPEWMIAQCANNPIKDITKIKSTLLIQLIPQFDLMHLANQMRINEFIITVS